MTDLTKLTLEELAVLVADSISGRGEGDIRPVDELFRRYRALEADRDMSKGRARELADAARGTRGWEGAT